MKIHFPIAVAVVCFSAALALSQSLGDIARQQRFLKPAPTARVITNEDIAARSGKKDQLARADITPAIDISIPKRDSKQPSTADVQSKILAQKQKVKALEKRIMEDQRKLDNLSCPPGVTCGQRVLLTGTGMGAPGPSLCDVSKAAGVHYYDDWCDEPAKLESDIAAAQKELATERTSLDAMQEGAR